MKTIRLVTFAIVILIAMFNLCSCTPSEEVYIDEYIGIVEEVADVMETVNKENVNLKAREIRAQTNKMRTLIKSIHNDEGKSSWSPYSYMSQQDYANCLETEVGEVNRLFWNFMGPLQSRQFYGSANLKIAIAEFIEVANLCGEAISLDHYSNSNLRDETIDRDLLPMYWWAPIAETDEMK